ncbi:hypothetical protein JYU34_002025 [Plutella xylostella]|uniref:Uncharacterized protein n=1 Tax=Plutella xylostella TaxID=51655 RepID=A0ABQ7R5C5_PLUXY|nr:hypothetical protein JYU34_002025 [Plutella xylostella]
MEGFRKAEEEKAEITENRKAPCDGTRACMPLTLRRARPLKEVNSTMFRKGPPCHGPAIHQTKQGGVVADDTRDTTAGPGGRGALPPPPLPPPPPPPLREPPAPRHNLTPFELTDKD